MTGYEELATIFAIIKKHNPNATRPISGADHDVIYFALGTDAVPEDSEDGAILNDICCAHIEGDGWARFV